MVDVQLGLRLWCQPVKLLADEVVLAFAAPHAPTIRHEVSWEHLSSDDAFVHGVLMFRPRACWVPRVTLKPTIGLWKLTCWRLGA